MTEIVIEDLTDGTPEGAGVFDTLMRSMRAHLDKEFLANRIRGADYASVYVGSLNAVMQYGVEYLLGRQRADKEAELLGAQTTKTSREADLVTKEIIKATSQNNLLVKELDKLGNETSNLAAQGLLLAKELNKMDAEIDILDQQENNLKADGVLTNQRILNLAAEKETIKLGQAKLRSETLLVDQQVRHMSRQVSKTDKEIELITQNILNAQEEINKSIAETALLNARTLTEAEQPAKVQAETGLITARTTNAAKEGVVLDKQATKIDSEVAVLNQKKFTEEAQVKDVVNGANVAGILGKQMNLYQSQADGFQRDAEQKILKALIDVYNVSLSKDVGSVNPTTAKLDSASIGTVVQKAAAGISVSL